MRSSCFDSLLSHNGLEQLVQPLGFPGEIQCAEQGFQTGGLCIFGGGGGFWHRMDVSVFPPAIVGKLLLGQQGQQLVWDVAFTI